MNKRMTYDELLQRVKELEMQPDKEEKSRSFASAIGCRTDMDGVVGEIPERKLAHVLLQQSEQRLGCCYPL